MLEDEFVLAGVFWDTNIEDINNIEDGLPGTISILDDEIICISAPNGIEARFTLYELEAIISYAHENGINDIRDED
jgi:hypothetical protein